MKVPLDRLDFEHEHAPPWDETMAQRLVDLANGRLGMYWAVVPLQFVRPFSPTYKPVGWVAWEPMLDLMRARIRDKQYPPLFTYQVGDFFVMSDDYFAYYAYLESGLGYAPCYILGEPTGDHIFEVRSATEDETKRVFGR